MNLTAPSICHYDGPLGFLVSPPLDTDYIPIPGVTWLEIHVYGTGQHSFGQLLLGPSLASIFRLGRKTKVPVGIGKLQSQMYPMVCYPCASITSSPPYALPSDSVKLPERRKRTGVLL